MRLVQWWSRCTKTKTTWQGTTVHTFQVWIIWGISTVYLAIIATEDRIAANVISFPSFSIIASDNPSNSQVYYSKRTWWYLLGSEATSPKQHSPLHNLWNWERYQCHYRFCSRVQYFIRFPKFSEWKRESLYMFSASTQLFYILLFWTVSKHRRKKGGLDQVILVWERTV